MSLLPELENEGIRVIKLLPNAIAPALKDGKPVSIYYTKPITFNVERSMNSNKKKNTFIPQSMRN